MMGVEPSKSEHEGQHAPVTLTHTFSRPAVARMFLRHFRYIRFHAEVVLLIASREYRNIVFTHTL